MVNRFFTDDMMALLTAPERWRIVSSLFPAEIAPCAHPRHEQWLQSHTHTHGYQEIIIGLRGHGAHGYCGEVYPFAPGAVFVFDLFEAHDSWYPLWSPDVDHLWITTLADHAYFRYVTVRNNQSPVTRDQLILTYDEIGIHARSVLFNRQLQEQLSPSARRFSLCAGLSVIIAYLMREGYREPQHEDVSVFQLRVIMSAQRHIEETSGNGVTLEKLADMSGYSKSHFTHLFREYVGMSVHEYIDHCRVRKLHELKALGYSQKAISCALGFSTPSSFARWCKRWEDWA